MILGADHSHWQKGIDPYKLIANGISFDIVKNGEYVSKYENTNKDPYYEDDYYAINMQLLEEAELPHGSYFFYHPKVGNSKQLRLFESLYTKFKHDFPPILDLEAHDGMFRWEYDTEMAKKIANNIFVMLEGMEKIAGRKPIIYTTASFWSYYVGDPNYGADYKFWLAQYNVKMTRWTQKIKDNIIMWQFTDKLAIPGCPAMDGNYWMGTEAEFYTMINKNDGTIPYQVEQITQNRIKKRIFALSKKNRQWLENITR